MNRSTFLKLLALPVVAPLVALFRKRKVGDRSFRMTIDDDGKVEIAWAEPLEDLEKRIEPRYKVRVRQGTNGPLLYTQGFDDTGRRVWNTRGQ